MKVPIRIPENVELLIQIGQPVDFATPFYRRGQQQQIHIPLSRILNFNPEKIFMALKKVIGDTIKKGELLAENKAFLSTKQYLSQVDGKIAHVDHSTGSVIIELDSQDNLVVNCYFTGEIDAIHDDHIEIKVKHAHQATTEENTEDFMGAPIFYLPESGQFSEEDIEDKYVCVTVINPLDHIKIEALGAKGYITGSNTPIESKIKQIVVPNPEDLEHITKNRYPFCIIGIQPNSIYFYAL